MKKIYNFSAGPAMLPKEVLDKVQHELLNWRETGASVMELSHRGHAFYVQAQEAQSDLKSLLNVPDNYKILFCQGGARGQFAAVPMNILGAGTQADYIESGYWSQSAAKEAEKYCQVNRHNIVQYHQDKVSLAPMQDWRVSSKSSYIHYCPNETIDGVALFDMPCFNDRVVVADYSSTLLSRPLDIRQYGVIYAGAQKNIGPSGLTLVIVRDDLLERAQLGLPSVFNYRILANHDSMYNTPPTFAWYVSGLVFKWIKRLGGLDVMATLNEKKATMLYDYIDHSQFYENRVAKENRSHMNIPFYSPSPELDKQFVREAERNGIIGIKGHRIVGGMRASLYNAMNLAGVEYLIDFMCDFAQRYKTHV